MKNRIDMKKMILAVFAAVAIAGSAGAQSGVKYPYVTTASDGGVIVVLRDDKGGISEAALFSSRVTTSKTGNEASTDNRMSRKFRVQKAQSQSSTIAWETAESYCNNLSEEGYSDWRLPTQRELMMIWLLGGNSNVTIGDKDDTGVASELRPINTPWIYQQPGFEPLKEAYYWSATEHSFLTGRGWVTHMGTGASSYKTNTMEPQLTRCVRDEW